MKNKTLQTVFIFTIILISMFWQCDYPRNNPWDEYNILTKEFTIDTTLLTFARRVIPKLYPCIAL